jgi:hypothetical protein
MNYVGIDIHKRYLVACAVMLDRPRNEADGPAALPPKPEGIFDRTLSDWIICKV